MKPFGKTTHEFPEPFVFSLKHKRNSNEVKQNMKFTLVLNLTTKRNFMKLCAFCGSFLTN